MPPTTPPTVRDAYAALLQQGYRITPVMDALWRVAWPAAGLVAVLEDAQLLTLAQSARQDEPRRAAR